MLRLVVIIGFCTLCIIPIAGFASNVISNEVLLIAFTFGFGYLALPAMLLYLWPTPQVKVMEAALASGDVVTVTYSAAKLAELQQIEDEGGTFLVETSDGKTLCLAGQYLVALIARKAFPALEFRTFVNRTTGMVYGVEPISAPLDSWIVYGKFTESIDNLVDGLVYDKPIGQLVSALGGNEVGIAHHSVA